MDDFNRVWMLKKIRKKAEDEKAKDKESSKDAPPSKTDSQDSEVEQAPEVEAEPRHLRADILGEDRPRVLAYSDSDSDVESHFKRVKDHLLPEKKTEDAAVEEDQAAAAAEAALSSTRKKAGSSLSKVAGLVSSQMSPPLMARTVALTALRRSEPRAATVVEGATFAVSLASFLFKTLSSSTGLLGTVCAQANELSKAAVLAAGIRLLLQARDRGFIPVGRRHSGVNVTILESAVRKPPSKPPETAAEFAVVYAPEMLEMKRMLSEIGATLPDRFDDTNAELLRFAKTCGLLEADTPAERGIALEKAVRKVLDACDWQNEQKILGESKLKRWERFVVWRSADAHQHPILLVRIGRALQLCKADRLKEFADAVISQIILCIRTKLDNEHGPEKVVVVMDCRDASNVDLLFKSRDGLTLLKRTATVLNAHFPERLEKLYLLELPLVGKAALQSVTAALNPSTVENILQVTAEDEGLPITVALLWKKRSVGKMLSRTLSDLSSMASEGTSAPNTPRDELDDERTTVALNLLPALEQQGAGGDASQEIKTPFTPSKTTVVLNGEETTPVADEDDGTIKSHSVPFTPSMLTPQTSVDSTKAEDVPEGADEENTATAKGYMPGLCAFIKAITTRSAHTVTAARARLKAHRIPTPTSPTEMSPRGQHMKGGLIDLPLRAKLETIPEDYHRKISIPPRSSLRPTTTAATRQEATPELKQQLGSFPLRRQSSVTWANDLTSVREIQSTPPSSNRGSMDALASTALQGQKTSSNETLGALLLLMSMTGGLLLKLSEPLVVGGQGREDDDGVLIDS